MKEFSEFSIFSLRIPLWKFSQFKAGNEHETMLEAI